MTSQSFLLLSLLASRPEGLLGSNLSCSPCPPQALKCEGSDIYLKEGYWRINNLSSYIHECTHTEACAGGALFGDESCGPGYVGPLCATCRYDYYMETNQGRCLQCPDRSFAALLVIICLVAFIVLAIIPLSSAARYGLLQLFGEEFPNKCNFTAFAVGLYSYILNSSVNNGDKDNTPYSTYISGLVNAANMRLVPKAKIVISLFQIVAAFRYVLLTSYKNVGMYKDNNTILDKIVNLSASIGLECFHSVDYVDYLLMVTVVPLVATTVFYFIFCMHYVWLERRVQYPYNTLAKLETSYFWMFLLASYIVLPQICICIFQVLSCDNVDPYGQSIGDNYYMRVDYSISCTSTRYHIAQGIAVVMFFLYPVGVPTLYLYVSLVDSNNYTVFDS